MMHPDAVREMLESRDAELAELRAEVERQKKLVGLAELSATAHRCNAAAANALLAEAPRDYLWPAWHERVRDHLDAQPATAPECSYVGRCNSSRCPKHGQPATAPARTEAARWVGKPGLPEREVLARSAAEYAQIIADFDDTVPARTEAEQAVLDPRRDFKEK